MIPSTANKASAVDVFAPIRIGAVDLPNRVAMAPLTRNRAAPGNVPQAMNVKYYTQRASAGLIISEATQISPEGVGYPNTPGIHSPEQIAGWRKVVDGVRAAGGRIFLQLSHVGRISHPSLQPNGALPVASSAIAPAGEVYTYEGHKPFVTPRALASEEIPGIVAQYAQGAKNAKAAGFDRVEVHAGNGYLLDQFLRDGTNQRTDRYGGSVENRARLLLEVTEAVVGVWGSDRVGVRLSPASAFNSMKDTNPQAIFEYVTKALSPLGLAYLPVIEVVDAVNEFNFKKLRQQFAGPYMANGGYTFEQAQSAIKNGDVDLVSFGRPLLANPDLVERFRRNAPLNEPDTATFYRGDEKGYTDYAALKRVIRRILRLHVKGPGCRQKNISSQAPFNLYPMFQFIDQLLINFSKTTSRFHVPGRIESAPA